MYVCVCVYVVNFLVHKTSFVLTQSTYLDGFHEDIALKKLLYIYHLNSISHISRFPIIPYSCGANKLNKIIIYINLESDSQKNLIQNQRHKHLLSMGKNILTITFICKHKLLPPTIFLIRHVNI